MQKKCMRREVGLKSRIDLRQIAEIPCKLVPLMEKIYKITFTNLEEGTCEK